MIAHSQKPDFLFRRNGRVHFNQWGVSVQSTTGSWVVRISGSNAGYTMFRGSVNGTGYPLHSSVSPSFPLSCVTVCHHISIGVYLQMTPTSFRQYRKHARFSVWHTIFGSVHTAERFLDNLCKTFTLHARSWTYTTPSTEDTLQTTTIVLNKQQSSCLCVQVPTQALCAVEVLECRPGRMRVGWILNGGTKFPLWCS